VRTGSQSKAAFVKRADAICLAVRGKFTREYTGFLKSRFKESSRPDRQTLQREAVDTVVIPSFKGDIDRISVLGAPSADKQKVTSFLESLQTRLDELHEDPSELSNSMFAKPAKAARAYGLTGCAETLGG